MSYKTVNPYTNELIKEYPNTKEAKIKTTLDADEELFKELQAQDISERAKVLHDIAKAFRDNSDEMAKMATIEMGKLISESKAEVEQCALIADWFADNSAEMLEDKEIEARAPFKAKLVNHASGILMMVEPWNFPYSQIMRVFAPNFMVGNPMILKDASNIPGSAELFEKMVKKAGAPKGSITNLFLDYDQVRKIISDPRVQGVALTGSKRGGKEVAQAAGKNLKKSTLELGGMDPFIVLSDADMKNVNDVAWTARINNMGQRCTSSKRFIVMDDVYDDFIEKLENNFKNLKPGDPLDSSTTLAPLNSKKAKEKLQKQVNDAIDAGAKVVYGNHPIDLPGQFFEPTILTNIDDQNPGFTTEFFGPVASVYKVNSEQEAIELANNSLYGLGGIVFAGDNEHGIEVAKQIETGMVFVNNEFLSLPELPFGGVKNSGYGHELDTLGQMTFVNQQLIVSSNHQ